VIQLVTPKRHNMLTKMVSSIPLLSFILILGIISVKISFMLKPQLIINQFCLLYSCIGSYFTKLNPCMHDFQATRTFFTSSLFSYIVSRLFPFEPGSRSECRFPVVESVWLLPFQKIFLVDSYFIHLLSLSISQTFCNFGLQICAWKLRSLVNLKKIILTISILVLS